MEVLKAYKFRLYPTQQQRRFFIETFGCVRFTYNTLLKYRQESHKPKKVRLTPAKLKEDFPFLKKTDSLALANAQLNLERAFRNYYKGYAGYPKLKTKRCIWQSYTTNNQHHTIYFQDGKLKLPKLKTLVSLNQHREVPGQIKSATISAKNNRIFYVSILCKEKVVPLPLTKRSVRLNFSKTCLVEASDSELSFPDFSQAEIEGKLQKAERKLAVRGKAARNRHISLSQAKNYQKQKEKVRNLYTHYYERKKTYLNELSMQIIRTYDEIYVKTNTKCTNETEAFTSSDWFHFIQMLKYKAVWYGKTVYINEENRSKIG